jgi:anti-sigma-K factor RskA
MACDLATSAPLNMGGLAAVAACASAHLVKDNKEQLATQQRAFEELLAQTSRMIALVGEAAPQASAKILWDTSRQQWVIYIYNLPLAPPEKDYQLWYITADQQKISAHVFRPDAQGHSQLRLSLPPGLASRLAATAVTLEPRGGSTQPTGQIYLKGAI